MLVYGIVLSLPGTVLGLPETAAELGLTLTSRGSLISALFVGLLLGSLLSGPIVDALGYRASLALSSGARRARDAAARGDANAAARGRGHRRAGRRGCRHEYRVERAVVGSLSWRARETHEPPGDSGGDWWRDDARHHRRGIGRRVVANRRRRRRRAGGGGRVGVRVGSAGRRRSLSAAAFAWTRPFAALARQPGFVWLAAALLLGGGNEAALAGWISTYLQAAGFSASASTWMLASHWLGLIVARVTLSPRVERTKAVAVVRSALAAAVCVAVFVLVGAHVWLAVMPFVIGCAIALVVPTMLAHAGDRYPGNTGAHCSGCC